MMFRLDPLDRDGETFANAEFAHMTTARGIAQELSREYGERVVIVRTGGDTPDKPVLVVLPDGSFAPPPTVRTTCTRLTDPKVPCWCPACRANRKAQR